MGIKKKLLFNTYPIIKKLVGFLPEKMFTSNYAAILMFHRVNDYDRGSLTTPTGVFEELLSVLMTQYRVVPLQSVITNILKKLSFEPKTVAITFDDGYQDNYVVAAPLLKKYGLPATFFVTSGFIGTEKVFPWDRESSPQLKPMNWNEVRDLARMGFEIGGHTVNHINLGVASVGEARNEIIECKKDIESHIEKRITAFAYPFGRKDCIRPEIYKIIADAGFNFCCSGFGGKINEQSDLFEIYRIPMYPTVIEMVMELDNFMTYYDGKMYINDLPKFNDRR